MQLPNFHWETFWQPGIAHALLLGVLPATLLVLFRDKENAIPHGSEYFIPKQVKNRMVELVRKLAPTSGHPRGLLGVLGCAHP